MAISITRLPKQGLPLRTWILVVGTTALIEMVAIALIQLNSDFSRPASSPFPSTVAGGGTFVGPSQVIAAASLPKNAESASPPAEEVSNAHESPLAAEDTLPDAKNDPSAHDEESELSQSPSRVVSPPRANEFLYLPPGAEISDHVALDAYRNARRLRETGDQARALHELRSAEARQPEHPAILNEMAEILRSMDLEDKARSYWKRILELPPELTGDYQISAQMALEGNIPIGKQFSKIGSEVLRVGEPQIFQGKNEDGHDRLTVRIPIHALGNELIDPNQVEVYIFFYDTLPNGQLEITSADTSETGWIRPPTWSDESETLEAIAQRYDDDQERSFYGFLFKIYYRDELMDVLAEPRRLIDYRPTSPENDSGLPDDYDNSSPNTLFPGLQPPLTPP